MQPHDRVVKRHRLGHEVDDASRLDQFGERVHFDEAQPVAGVLAADQSFERQPHALDVDVLAVVAHRAAHVHEHARGALGRVARAVNLDVVGVEPHRHAWAVAHQRVDERAGDVEVRDRVAELVLLRGLQLNGAFADDRALVPAGARRRHFLKQPLQQLALEQAIGLWREPEAARFLLQALLLGHLAQVVLNLLLQRAELVDVARFGELGEQVHVDDADVGRLAGLFELLEQLVDLFQLFLDRQGLRHRHRLVAREFILGGQFIDLVLVAEPLDNADQRTGPRRLVVTGGVPQPFQVANLLGLHRFVKRLAELFRHLGFAGLIGERLVGAAGGPFAFRSVRESFASAPGAWR